MASSRYRQHRCSSKHAAAVGLLFALLLLFMIHIRPISSLIVRNSARKKFTDTVIMSNNKSNRMMIRIRSNVGTWKVEASSSTMTIQDLVQSETKFQP